MQNLPMLIADPVRRADGIMRLVLPGRPPIPVRSVAEAKDLLPGWQAEALFTLLDPLWILALRHESGETACWFLDRDGRLAAGPEHWPEPDLSAFRRRLQPIGPWLRMAPGAPIRVPVPEAVRAYAALPDGARRALDPLLGGRLPPAPVAGLPDAAPPVLFEAVAGTRGYRVGNPGRLVPVTDNGGLAELGEGWCLEEIETAFAPLLALVLRREDGARGIWFIDGHGRLVSHHVELLPPDLQDHVVLLACALFDGLWTEAVLGEGPVTLGGRQSIGRLRPDELAGLAPAYLRMRGEPEEMRVWRLDEPPPAGLGYVVPARGVRLVCDPVHAGRALAHSIHDEMVRLVRTGRMRWPSPADGSLVESDGFALLLDRNGFAYRFRDEAAGLTFFVVCSGGYFRNAAIYLPAANLMVCPTREVPGDLMPLGQFGAAMLRHALRSAEALAEGSRLPLDEAVQQCFGACASHIGHYVWQDLAGLAFLLRKLAGSDRLPQLQMFDIDRTTPFFGPEERIFPLLDGRISRHREPFGSHVDTFYRRNQRIITYTAISVPADLRHAVTACAEAAPELLPARGRADEAALRPTPVILIGLRVGNRTMPDLPDFAAALLRHLGGAFPGCTVILDGLNDQLDRRRALRPQVPSGTDLDQEFAIGCLLEDVADEAGVRFVDNIAGSALRSVLWCSRADCFIAPLGAALAKYRWLCNTPGLVLSSRWNLENRADLHIYDAPAALEGSSEMLFNSVEHVQDIPAAEPGRTDFILDRDAVFAEFTALVRRHAQPRIARLAVVDAAANAAD